MCPELSMTDPEPVLPDLPFVTEISTSDGRTMVETCVAGQTDADDPDPVDGLLPLVVLYAPIRPPISPATRAITAPPPMMTAVLGRLVEGVDRLTAQRQHHMGWDAVAS